MINANIKELLNMVDDEEDVSNLSVSLNVKI